MRTGRPGTTGAADSAPACPTTARPPAGERRLGAYFGVLSSVGGLAVLIGSSALGSLYDAARVSGPAAALPWVVTALCRR